MKLMTSAGAKNGCQRRSCHVVLLHAWPMEESHQTCNHRSDPSQARSSSFPPFSSQPAARHIAFILKQFHSFARVFAALKPFPSNANHLSHRPAAVFVIDHFKISETRSSHKNMCINRKATAEAHATTSTMCLWEKDPLYISSHAASDMKYIKAISLSLDSDTSLFDLR